MVAGHALPDTARYGDPVACNRYRTQLSTTGGTSDGRFIASICPQVVEFGPCNASIHKLDERVALADIDALRRVYQRVLGELLLQAA